MSSFSPGPTTSCTVFLSGLVKYPDRFSPSVTRHVGTAALQTVCWRCDREEYRLICGLELWTFFILKIRASTSMQIALYAGIYSNANTQDSVYDAVVVTDLLWETDGWPCPGSIPGARHLFRYVTNQPPKASSAFHPSRVGKWVPTSAGKAKAGMVHSVSGWMRVCR